MLTDLLKKSIKAKKKFQVIDLKKEILFRKPENKINPFDLIAEIETNPYYINVAVHLYLP